MSSLNSIRDWLFNRQIDGVEHALKTISNLPTRKSNLLDERFLPIYRDLSQELLMIETVYRANLTPEDRNYLQEIAEEFEKIWRTLNLSARERTVTQQQIFLSTRFEILLKTVKIILTNLKELNLGKEVQKPVVKSSRSNGGGIWDPAVVILLSNIDDVFGKSPYCLVGGTALQVYFAAFLNQEVVGNQEILSRCRPIHDVDIIFPDRTAVMDGFNYIQKHPSTFDSADYTIELTRKGEKKPTVKISVISESSEEIHESEIILNITNNHKDAIGMSAATYNEAFATLREVQIIFEGKKLTLKVISPEHFIISKCNRLADKDFYDVMLLMEIVPEINLDYVRSKIEHPEKYEALFSKLLRGSVLHTSSL